MRTSTLEGAGAEFGFGYHAMRKLAGLISMPAFKVARTGHAFEVEWDEAIRGPKDLLPEWVRFKAGTLCEDDFPTYRAIRQTVYTREVPHPVELVEPYARLRGRATQRQISRDLGGDETVCRAMVAAVNATLGMPGTERARSVSPCSLERFLAEVAPELERLPASSEDFEYGYKRRAPSERELGRAAGMSHRENAVLTGLVLFGASAQLGPSLVAPSLGLIERLDRHADGLSLADPANIAAALRSRFIDNPLRSTFATLRRDLDCYDWTRGGLDRWWNEVPKAVRERFSRYLLPPIPTSIRAHVMALAPSSNDDVEEGSEDAPAPTVRDADAKEVSERRKDIVSKLENRWAAFEPMMVKFKDELARVARELAAGVPLRFPIPVAHTWPVVRPDGSPGVGRQTVFARIETSASLWRQCADTDKSDRELQNWLSRADRIERRVRQGPDPVNDGVRYDPSSETRLHLVYLGTLPTEPGGEVHECWLFDLLRKGVFGGHEYLPPDVRVESDALRRELRLTAQARAPGQLLAFHEPGDMPLAAACRRTLGVELIPVLPALHGIAIGRVVTRCELLNGLRVGATAQARDDDGCFTARKIRGKLVFFMKASMKGDGDTERYTIIDPRTVAAFEAIRLLWLERFNGGVDALLPDFKCGAMVKRAMPRAGYLLSVEKAALTIDALNVLVIAALAGIVNTTTHPLKYGFAVMVKDAGATPRQLNIALHHSVGSEISEHYVRFADDEAVAELIAEAHDMLEEDDQLYRLIELA